ncbi:hypothetical protein CEXT_802251 [Caerostris extrusa]|uniref:Uncharacterized protein n=1 Tax=Caerostris extrusa TaxID=172846 RepID=A0AAV4NU99_CAEEX|nr:hypothetical protein CEXT_802251 [Caerostris extrusa]
MPQGKQKDYERTRLHYEISSIYAEEKKKRNGKKFFQESALVYFEASRILSLSHFRELSLPLGKNTFRYRNGRLSPSSGETAMPQGKQKDYERTRLHYEISYIYEEEKRKGMVKKFSKKVPWFILRHLAFYLFRIFENFRFLWKEYFSIQKRTLMSRPPGILPRAGWSRNKFFDGFSDWLKADTQG